jgi:hypothetical protein
MQRMNLWGVAMTVGAILLGATSASAQATRTWVSGVGDDANPCSRTAPCKTFAGAISKTAAGGEINVLDPGGYGGVTITKSITISSEGFEAGVLVSGTNAIIVNAGAADIVVLRGLDIEGLGTGLNGIRFLNGGSLHVEDCTINRFTQFGIDFEPSGASQLLVTNTIVRNNNGTSGAGILLRPGTTGSAAATFDDVNLAGNRVGIRIDDRSKATGRNVVVGSTTTFGIQVKSVTAIAELNLSASQIANSTNAAVRSEGSLAMVRLSDSNIHDNGAGLVSVTGGAIVSFGNNRIAGNTVDGTPTLTLPQQ